VTLASKAVEPEIVSVAAGAVDPGQLLPAFTRRAALPAA